MLNLTIVIAQLHQRLTLTGKAIVSLMQTVGLVRREPTAFLGKPYSVPTTPRHSQPAPTQPSQSKEAVKPTTQAGKSGKENKTVQPLTDKQLTQGGSKSKTPASKTRQRAKQASKANKSNAKRVTQE